MAKRTLAAPFPWWTTAAITPWNCGSAENHHALERVILRCGQTSDVGQVVNLRPIANRPPGFQPASSYFSFSSFLRISSAIFDSPASARYFV